MFSLFKIAYYKEKPEFFAQFENNNKIKLSGFFVNNKNKSGFTCAECGKIRSVKQYCAHCDKCCKCCVCSDLGYCSNCNHPFKSFVPGASVERSESDEDLCALCEGCD